MNLKVTIFTPKKTIFDIISDELFVPIENGQFAIKTSFQSHTSIVKDGVLRIKNDSKWLLFVVSDGVVVTENNVVSIFLKTARRITFLTHSEILEGYKKTKETMIKNTYETIKILEQEKKIKSIIQAAQYLSPDDLVDL